MNDIVTSIDTPATDHDGGRPHANPTASAASVVPASAAIAAAGDGDVVRLREKIGTCNSQRLKTQLQLKEFPMLRPNAPFKCILPALRHRTLHTCLRVCATFLVPTNK